MNRYELIVDEKGISETVNGISNMEIIGLLTVKIAQHKEVVLEQSKKSLDKQNKK